jgi:hypothetical protein
MTCFCTTSRTFSPVEANKWIEESIGATSPHWSPSLPTKNIAVYAQSTDDNSETNLVGMKLLAQPRFLVSNNDTMLESTLIKCSADTRDSHGTAFISIPINKESFGTSKKPRKGKNTPGVPDGSIEFLYYNTFV